MDLSATVFYLVLDVHAWLQLTLLNLVENQYFVYNKTDLL
jgi:hypothetical protein